jgi:hypothetical protein
MGPNLRLAMPAGIPRKPSGARHTTHGAASIRIGMHRGKRSQTQVPRLDANGPPYAATPRHQERDAGAPRLGCALAHHEPERASRHASQHPAQAV